KLWRRERWLAERGREEMERNGRGKMNKVHYLSSLLGVLVYHCVFMCVCLCVCVCVCVSVFVCGLGLITNLLNISATSDLQTKNRPACQTGEAVIKVINLIS